MSEHADKATTPLDGEAESLARALVAEATKKSDLVWLAAEHDDTVGRARPVWHIWADDALYLVVDGAEQPLPDVEPDDLVRITVRSRDAKTSLVTWRGRVSRIDPDSTAWESVVPQLHAARLNHRDGERQPRRWALESRVLRVEPLGHPLELPDEIRGTGPVGGPLPAGSGAAPVAPSPAVTRRPRERGPRNRRSGPRDR